MARSKVGDPHEGCPSGVMRLKARVEFVEKSGKRAKTFRVIGLRCAQSAVEQAPPFAG